MIPGWRQDATLQVSRPRAKALRQYRAMSRSESDLREEICALGLSLFSRGLTSGSSGNISVRLPDGWLMTPTNASLGRLQPERLSKLDAQGRCVSGDPPTKESFLHRAMYAARPHEQAIVHLHSTYSVAVSCLRDADRADVLPPITAYYVMRVGHLPLVPYHRPGDTMLAQAVADAAVHAHAILLANHGPIVAGASLDIAANAIEELEQTAKLFLLLRGLPVRTLSADEIARLS